ncbi:hypothetical protein PybrP1_007616 [[Pythium] brassicae (nom. inval.)]|nr:hypothetical protein PybrP1_007616 [[Pythium] brassicae (nom. inval.)]
MQRERLEGWMVKQIENADLAKDTVIQLPAQASASSPLPRYAQLDAGALRPSSPRRAPVSPRRRLTSSSAVAIASPSPPADSEHRRKTADGAAAPHSAATTPQSPRQRGLSAAATDRNGRVSFGHAPKATSLEKQWRAHFGDASKQAYAEQSGRVDRTQVLRWNPLESDSSGAGGLDADESTSPLFLWGLPREHIVEYIRQSVLPSSWSMATKFNSGEWEAVTSTDDDTDAHDSLAKALASLPPLSVQPKTARDSAALPTGSRPASRWSNPTSLRGSQTARPPAKRPHTSPFQAGVALSTGVSSAPRSEDRLTRVLNELRTDPSLWEAFAKTRESKQRMASPRLATTLEERKKQAEERMERARRQREQLVRQEELRLEAQLSKYQQRFGATKRLLTAEERAKSVGYRRRRLWLTTVAFARATAAWRAKFLRTKQLALVAKLQSRAARTIQRVWRQWRWRHASKHTVIIYTWLRRCLWRLLFNVRCRRRARCASVLQRFMVDQFSGSREMRNFNLLMVQWRNKVIYSQRLSRDFVVCTRARLQALSLLWDRVDHERQRSERQQHERFLPTEEKEAEWTAMLHSRKLLKRQSSQRASTISGSAAPPSASSAPRAEPPGFRKSTNHHNAAAMLQLEHMDERLTSMQQVLTPIEIQRLQQNAYHVVRVARSVKMQLLHEFLAAARDQYLRRLIQFHQQRLSASFTREVRVDDARAIVQNSLSWECQLADRRTGAGLLAGASGSRLPPSSASARPQPPQFELYTVARTRMEELVKSGVQLTLERDHEQRALVERQKQQRQSINTMGGPAHALVRKRESGSATAPSERSGLSRRQTSRRLAFTLPLKDPTAPPTAVVEGVTDLE